MTHEVAALYVDERGPYMDMDGVDQWTVDRDARLYDGPNSVVAHPPCADWSRLRAFARRDDARKSCGPRAVEQVREFGGVLEHPAHSSLWRGLSLPRPYGTGYLCRSLRDSEGGFTLAVNQCDWGHKAQKATWLYISGVHPRDVPALPLPGTPTHVVTTSRRGPRLTKMGTVEGRLTPPAFAAFLVDIARRAG